MTWWPWHSWSGPPSQLIIVALPMMWLCD